MRHEEVEALLADLGGEIAWREPSKKTCELRVRLDANVSYEHWSELYAWLASGLLRMHVVASGLLASNVK